MGFCSQRMANVLGLNNKVNRATGYAATTVFDSNAQLLGRWCGKVSAAGGVAELVDICSCNDLTHGDR